MRKLWWCVPNALWQLLLWSSIFVSTNADCPIPRWQHVIYIVWYPEVFSNICWLIIFLVPFDVSNIPLAIYQFFWWIKMFPHCSYVTVNNYPFLEAQCWHFLPCRSPSSIIIEIITWFGRQLHYHLMSKTYSDFWSFRKGI